MVGHCTRRLLEPPGSHLSVDRDLQAQCHKVTLNYIDPRSSMEGESEITPGIPLNRPMIEGEEFNNRALKAYLYLDNTTRADWDLKF